MSPLGEDDELMVRQRVHVDDDPGVEQTRLQASRRRHRRSPINVLLFILVFLVFKTILPTKYKLCDFYRAMYYSAKRGLAIACRAHTISPAPSLFVAKRRST